MTAPITFELVSGSSIFTQTTRALPAQVKMKLEFIKEQTDWVDKWTTGLISNLSETDWEVFPSLKTSLNWEVGHIIISKYFHCVQSVLKPDDEIIQKVKANIPLDDFFKYYFAGSDPTELWSNRPNPKRLLELREVINEAASTALEKLTESVLQENTEIKNPVAKIKYDALTFSFKHQMWHNGQIAMIKRVVG